MDVEKVTAANLLPKFWCFSASLRGVTSLTTVFSVPRRDNLKPYKFTLVLILCICI